MAKASGTAIEKYNARLASTLRELMMKSPKTGEPVTQKELAEHLGVRPQTVSLYCTGESLPNSDQLLAMGDYFGVTADFLITGRKVENKPVRDMLGLSERTVECLKLVKDGYFEDTPYMLAMLDTLLGEKDFYSTLEKAAELLNSRDNVDADELKQFYEWKAHNAMQDFFVDFFSRNLQAIYSEKQ